MIEIPIQAVPNQSLTFESVGGRYDLVIRDSDGIVSVDVTREDVVIIQGSRAMPSGAIIPYRHLESGNFAIITEEDAYPAYLEFGVSQRLFYLTPAELEALRSGN